MINHFSLAYEKYAGAKWHVDYGKIGMLVKKLLVTYQTGERVCELIDKFFAQPDGDFLGRAGRDFGVFYSQVNRLAMSDIVKTISQHGHDHVVL